MGIMAGLKAFVAAVLGGIGNIPGAVLGGLVMGVAEVLVVGYLSPTWRDAIAFVLLIVILLVRPAGILAKHVAEKVCRARARLTGRSRGLAGRALVPATARPASLPAA